MFIRFLRDMYRDFMIAELINYDMINPYLEIVDKKILWTKKFPVKYFALTRIILRQSSVGQKIHK